MRRMGAAMTRSKYQSPATLPGLRVEGMGPPLWEFSLRYGGGRQKLSLHEQRRLVGCTRRSEERTHSLRRAKPQRGGHSKAPCCFKIGRASCRERVEISGGAGSFKKKKKGERGAESSKRKNKRGKIYKKSIRDGV